MESYPASISMVMDEREAHRLADLRKYKSGSHGTMETAMATTATGTTATAITGMAATATASNPDRTRCA
jgi:hypothetical protein